ncbi:hypothetical protein RCH09_003259 [Actimicrobium sp. GrIS 1.19]|uniref:hypothetical protein n=1 Tax=Actimicrobium sp. GrIS 1.19 TaxID=3071708 RepID=UPI002DFEEA20|nr:hypothetical protein [Actimicrobium sp. GrIS 1.19]
MNLISFIYIGQVIAEPVSNRMRESVPPGRGLLQIQEPADVTMRVDFCRAPPMQFKHNTERRHHIPKMKFKVQNRAGVGMPSSSVLKCNITRIRNLAGSSGQYAARDPLTRG